MAVSNVKDGYIDWTRVKTIDVTEEEVARYRLAPYDVLMTEGGDPDKLGRGALLLDPPEDCIHQNHVFRVRITDERLRPEYFEYYLQSPRAKHYFFSCAKRTTGIATINKKQISGLPVVMPPISQQEAFISFVHQVDKLGFVDIAVIRKHAKRACR
jgi:type I restriction enzyme S subunit